MAKGRTKTLPTEGSCAVRRRRPQRPQSSHPPATPTTPAAPAAPATPSIPPPPITLIPGILAELPLAQQMANSGLPAIAIVFYRVPHVQQTILSYLNLIDAANIALANRRILKIMTVNMPLEGWVGTGCGENRRGVFDNPDSGTCPHGAQPTKPMRLCPGNVIPPCFTLREHNTGYVCWDCWDTTRAANRVRERKVIQGNRIGVCTLCEGRERSAHPDGFSSCTCAEALEAEYKCFTCRARAFNQIAFLGDRWCTAYRRTSIDAWGRATVNWNRHHPLRPWHAPACRCGAVHQNHNQRRVVLCLGCQGVVVASTPNFNPKRSSRIRAQPPRQYKLIEGNWPLN